MQWTLHIHNYLRRRRIRRQVTFLSFFFFALRIRLRQLPKEGSQNRRKHFFAPDCRNVAMSVHVFSPIFFRGGNRQPPDASDHGERSAFAVEAHPVAINIGV
jgi:hypothetical protein